MLSTYLDSNSIKFQNGLLGRSKSFLLDANKELDTLKIVAALKNRLRLLNISLHTFIDSVLLRKHNGTMVSYTEGNLVGKYVMVADVLLKPEWDMDSSNFVTTKQAPLIEDCFEHHILDNTMPKYGPYNQDGN